MNTIRLGSRGSDVSVWQKIVGITADGIFGPKTQHATKYWQTAHNLKSDGIVGPRTWAKALAPEAAPEMLRGLDASAVQGKLPYDLLLQEIDAKDAKFAILKGQEGNGGFDSMFVTNANAGRDAGLEVNPYCFLYPLPHLNPIEQAKRFVAEVHKRVPWMRGRRFFLDMEWPEVVPLKPGPKAKAWKEWGCSPTQLADWMGENAEAVTQESGTKPAIYIYDWWWACVRDGAPAYGFPDKGDVSWAAEYDLWMAWYRSGWPIPGDNPKVPKPFRDWLFWQFDGNGGLRLPNGVDSDFCVFNGDVEKLRAWTKGE